MAKSNSVKSLVFVWEGKNRRGQKTRGELQGQSVSLVKAQLRKQGISPSKVYKKRAPLFSSGSSIKPKDIALFIRQLSTMAKAGIPLVQALDIVADGTEKPSLKSTIQAIRDDVAAGNTFASALKRFNSYFDNLTCSLIESGERSGELETVLDRVATYKEKMEALKTKINKASRYPIAVLVVAVCVAALLLIKVVPTFEEMFQSFGADLPVVTQVVIDLSDFAQKYWYYFFAVAIAGVFTFRMARQRSPSFSDSVESFTLKLPVFGDVVRKSAIARYCRVLSTTFAAGVPLVQALDAAASSTGNATYRDAVQRIREDVSTGQQLNFAMRSSGVFPNMAVQMTAVGEESGSLENMLAKAATYYEDEVDVAVDNLTSLMEPAIMVVLGILIGGLVLAMYLPIFQIGNVI